jgi:hypothetical protein
MVSLYKSFDFIFFIIRFYLIYPALRRICKLGVLLSYRNVNNGILTIVTEDTNEIALPFNTVSAPGRGAICWCRQCHTIISNNISNHYTTTGVVDNC